MLEWEVAALVNDCKKLGKRKAQHLLRALEWCETCFDAQTHYNSKFVRAQAQELQVHNPDAAPPCTAKLATCEMLAKLEELVFTAPTAVMRIWAGAHCCLAHGVL